MNVTRHFAPFQPIAQTFSKLSQVAHARFAWQRCAWLAECAGGAQYRRSCGCELKVFGRQIYEIIIPRDFSHKFSSIAERSLERVVYFQLRIGADGERGDDYG